MIFECIFYIPTTSLLANQVLSGDCAEMPVFPVVCCCVVARAPADAGIDPRQRAVQKTCLGFTASVEEAAIGACSTPGRGSEVWLAAQSGKQPNNR